MQPTQLHQTIAFQIDNMRPAHLVPGKHVGMEVLDENTVGITVVPTGVTATVTYEEGPDLYSVSVKKHTEDEPTEYTGVYCDMLGELIFGINAEPASFPMVELFVLDPETGDVIDRTIL